MRTQYQESPFNPTRISIPPDGEHIRENAFAAYKRKRDAVAQRTFKTRLSRQRSIVKDSVRAFTRSIRSQLAQHVSLPSPSDLPPPYQHILSVLTNLEAIPSAKRRIRHALPILSRITQRIMRRLSSPEIRTLTHVEALRREAIGRLISFLEDLEEPVHYLREYARILRSLPVIPPTLPLILIMGLPNAGKTSLYNQLTGSHAEAADYAFTTQQLNATPLTLSTGKVLLIDTPGILPRSEKNQIERLAEALIPDACAIILIQDPSQPQEHHTFILNHLQNQTRAPIIPYIIQKKEYPVLWHPQGIACVDDLLTRLAQIIHTASPCKGAE